MVSLSHNYLITGTILCHCGMTRLDVGLLIVSTVKLEYFTANKIAVRSITNLTVELGIIWRQNT